MEKQEVDRIQAFFFSYRDAFKAFDVYEEGKIDFVELYHLLSAFGHELTRKECLKFCIDEHRLQVKGANIGRKKNFISFKGFVDIAEKLEEKKGFEKRAKEAFAIIDVNGKGKAKEEDFVKAGFAREIVQNWFDQLDSHLRDYFTEEDFVTFYKRVYIWSKYK
eukprot:snap_masked-scaffold_9-processed-gene-10.21-mRNA-1 protein AED:1.00 eAED:1.00 QI:0/0/0/0/1/1/2/0/162